MRYPFAALVGQEQLKLALLLNAVDPSIGGVLICGEKGTAKTTAARGLSDLLPPIQVREGCRCNSGPDDPPPVWDADGLEPTQILPSPLAGEGPGVRGSEFSDRLLADGGQTCAPVPFVELPVPFVELPLGATEDRVVGTLDFERALQAGRRAFQPGLLAAANRGILYVDEVNLLADHLVDVLLDVAASGVNIVEREGIAVNHPARFLLVGTMNPEEGRLRPQLLDRFGLMVEVAGPRDPAVRAEVVGRRIAFEEGPTVFTARWEQEQKLLRRQIVAARKLLPDVFVSDEVLCLISMTCCEAGVDGLRGDIVLYKTARALAAFDQRRDVTPDDVKRGSELALAHRRRTVRPSSPNRESPREHDPHGRSGESAAAQSDSPPAGDQNGETEPAENDTGDDTTVSSAAAVVFPAAPAQPVRPIRIAAAEALGGRATGRRNKSAAADRGRYVRAVPDPQPADLAVDATLRSAAMRGAAANGGIEVRRSDLHRKERLATAGTLILFVVDVSGSMAARRRMEAVKGAVLGLLEDAYMRRDQVAVIAFRGPTAQLVLSPTSSVDLAQQALQSLPTGGRTPLAHALSLAGETIDRARQSDQELLVLLVVLTDGKANVPLPGSAGDAWHQALDAAALLAASDVTALVVDTDSGLVRAGRAQALARALDAECLTLEELSADTLTLEISQRRGSAMGAANLPASANLRGLNR